MEGSVRGHHLANTHPGSALSSGAEMIRPGVGPLPHGAHPSPQTRSNPDTLVEGDLILIAELLGRRVEENWVNKYGGVPVVLWRAVNK